MEELWQNIHPYLLWAHDVHQTSSSLWLGLHFAKDCRCNFQNMFGIFCVRYSFLSNSAAFTTWVLRIYLPTCLEWGEKLKEGLIPLKFLSHEESGLSSLHLLPLPSGRRCAPLERNSTPLFWVWLSITWIQTKSILFTWVNATWEGRNCKIMH